VWLCAGESGSQAQGSGFNPQHCKVKQKLNENEQKNGGEESSKNQSSSI
jgi:hypothetical protein